jgi:hypothetical protein
MIEVENPISSGATIIRKSVETFVQTQLKDNFPKNYHYMVGNYNSVFQVIEGYGDQAGGFFRNAKMIVLTPDGKLKTGQVHQRVGDYHSSWEFYNAKLEPASDLDVVKFGPVLVRKLFAQIETEITDLEDQQKIENSLNVLIQRGKIWSEIETVSRQSRLEMGEEDIDKHLGDADFGDMAKEDINNILTGFSNKEVSSLNQMKSSFEFFKKKRSLMQEVKDLSANMRAKNVEAWFQPLVANLVENKIFPETAKDEGEIRWFVANRSFEGYYFNVSDKRGGFWYWGVSENGQVRKAIVAEDKVVEQRWDAEQLLTQSDEVVRFIVNAVARNAFPKIKV